MKTLFSSSRVQLASQTWTPLPLLMKRHNRSRPVGSSLNIINPTVPLLMHCIHIHFSVFVASAGAGKLKARFENMAKASDEENRKRAEEEKARRQARESRERELAKSRQEVCTVGTSRGHN